MDFHGGDQAPVEDGSEAVAADTTIAIGGDERRMHVRAYNYWTSLLEGRDYPSIEDLDPGNIEDFASNSVLLDFTADPHNPATAYIGAAIREECELGPEIQTISQVPSRSLLSRLTDHYLQIIANRAPIGFEAEFMNQRGLEICYRGILMPFSSDGDTIDFIYGVINWKASERQSAASLPALELSPADAHPAWEDGPLHDGENEGENEPLIALDEDAGLADRLCAARETAEICKAADGRSRAALYRALSMAYDFSVATRRVPEEYLEILEDAGVKAQARAPMTPIVKLVFGADYDKTRLTEFAAALAHAERCKVDFEGFLPFVEQQPGGLKGLVAAEREARRPAAKPDTRLERGRERLRSSAPRPLGALAGNGEFALVLVRRSSDGTVEPVSAVEDMTMLEKAIRRAGV
ncbi:hypothetical protein ACFQPG_03545 [Sphingomonas sp. GCM10030256]|uniref:PAS domain-containing protein n=1 Tax=Sphingomonas sp. GCM10030256 TaxID=3273427 RepID=UPI00362371FC